MIIERETLINFFCVPFVLFCGQVLELNLMKRV